MKKILIGITGGIGSGKSTVTEYYKELGYYILKADDIAKQVMVEDEAIIANIKKEFGGDCYIDGRLNTKYLAEKAFSHPDRVAKLNKIVHPKAIAKVKKEAGQLLNEKNIVIVEAAILFEAHWEDIFDYIILITSDENNRIKRVIERDNVSIKEIKSRMMHQLPDNDKKGKADFVIENNSSIEALKERAKFIITLIENISKNS
jgi:dephospho-CoA kinase